MWNTCLGHLGGGEKGSGPVVDPKTGLICPPNSLDRLLHLPWLIDNRCPQVREHLNCFQEGEGADSFRF